MWIKSKFQITLSYLTTTAITFEVAARAGVPANDHVIEQVPAATVFTVARVKIPPVLSCVTTDPTVQTAGVVDTADKRCPILKSPELFPFA